jgi:hypothetical protein
VLLSICAFAQSAWGDETAANAKTQSTQKGQVSSDKTEAPIFKTEKSGASQKLTFTLTVPTNIEEGWQSCLRTTSTAAQTIGQNATALGKWLDDGFKKIDTGSRPEQVYISPLVSSASKYCSKFHPCYFQDGRIKTVAHR